MPEAPTASASRSSTSSARRGQDEGQPVDHTINNNALLGKIDWRRATPSNLSVSYNFNYSKNDNQTFDVATYGEFGQRHRRTVEDQRAQRQSVQHGDHDEAERVSRDVLSRRSRPRLATRLDDSRGHGDRVRDHRSASAIRSSSRPNVDELVKRFQVKDNFSIVERQPHHQGRRRVAAHQQRPGVPRLLRGPLHLRQRHRVSALRLPGGTRGVRTEHGRLLERHLRHRARGLSGGTTAGGPLLFYLQSSSPDGIARDAAGASDINNEELALFVQDKWQMGHGADVRLRHCDGTRRSCRRPSTRRRRRIAFVPERSAFSVGRHDSESGEGDSAARSGSPGT